MKKLLLLSLLLAATCSQAQEVSKTFVNPLWKGADPWIVKHDGMYYTCRSVAGGIEVSQSRFMTRKETKRIVWRAPENAWNSFFIWAPEVHFVDGKWYIYYAAGKENKTPYIWQRAGVLECDTPLGDYRDRGMLYTGDDPRQEKDNVWGIDMTVFKHREKLYAVWSGWEKQRGTDATGQNLYIASMENPWTIGKRVLLSKPDQPWERGEHISLQEGPSALRHGDDLFIIYSTRGSWTVNYCLGQLRLRSPESDPLNPASWIKSGPVFSGDDRVLGVGHASFATSPDDTEYWIYYHSKTSRENGWKDRVARLQPFTFDNLGNPVFGHPAAPGAAIARPAGEYEREIKPE